MNKCQNKIPEKTILDEVYLRKTLYCSGTQQNLQAHPEQRNVAIQQIFRNQPEYVEVNNRNIVFETRGNEQQQQQQDDGNVIYHPCPNKKKIKNFRSKTPDDDINKTSLGRFYLPDKPRAKSCQCQKPPNEFEQMTMNNYSRTGPTGENYKTICLRIPIEKTDSNGQIIIQEHGNKTVYCSCDSITDQQAPTPTPTVCNHCKCSACNPPSFAAYETKKIVCGDNPGVDGVKLCPSRATSTSTSTIKEQFNINEWELSKSITPKSVPASSRPGSSKGQKKNQVKCSQTSSKLQKGTSEKRHSSPANLIRERDVDCRKEAKLKIKIPPKKQQQQQQPEELVRNTNFWKKINEKVPEEPIHIPNIPHSMPVIPMTCKTQDFRNYQSVILQTSRKPIIPINALDHDTFHSAICPTAPVENMLMPEEEAAQRRCRKRSQALSLQKSCLLRRSLRLTNSRTRLIYRTEMSNSAPFRSELSENSQSTSPRTSRNEHDNENDNSNTIIVIPEACKQNIVDSPKSVTFSSNTRLTTEDMDAKCRKLMELHFNDTHANCSSD